VEDLAILPYIELHTKAITIDKLECCLATGCLLGTQTKVSYAAAIKPGIQAYGVESLFGCTRGLQNADAKQEELMLHELPQSPKGR